MFSRRLSWEEPTNALSRLLEQKRQHGVSLLDLTLSNPTKAGLAPPPEILRDLLHPGSLAYEPNPRGLRAARCAVADYYARRGFSVDPDRVWLTASTSEGYSILFKLLADPGDSVLVPRPSYPLFEMLAQLDAVKTRPYSLRYHGEWWIDFSALRSLAEGAKALVVVAPNNPTGSCLRRFERDLLGSLGLPLLADEVFGDYLDAPSPEVLPSLVEEREIAGFVMSGFSKVLGLPQMKLGWIIPVGPDSFVHAAEERLELICDTYLSVSAPVQHAAASWLAAQDVLTAPIQARVRENRAWLRAQLGPGSLCSLLRSDGGWSVVLRVPASRSEDEWALTLLRDENVVVHPGYFFDFEREAYLVLSLLPAPEVFREGVARLLHHIAQQNL
jgi:hypothetical protein